MNPWIFIRKNWRKYFWHQNWYKKWMLCRWRLFIGKSYLLEGWHDHPETKQ